MISLLLYTGLVPGAGKQLVACSVFNASRIDKVLAATNKDWNNRETRILFLPASADKYGRVYFGYQVDEGFQNVGGMNEQGLWYDGASLPARSDIENHYNKPRLKGELCEKALEECSTVDEVIDLYSEYYTPHWQGHSMWADRNGNSVIIEFGEKDVVFIRKEQGFQVMTNYYVSDPENSRWYNCHRFRAISEILSKADNYSVEVMTEALDASHKEGLTPTLFSNVYDLREGEIYIYHFHQYEEVLRLNLAYELDKGDQYLELPGLFHGLKTLAPGKEQLIDNVNIEFKWSGAPGTYELYCSEDKAFLNEAPVSSVSLPEQDADLLGFPYLVILGVLTGISIRVKKRLPHMLLLGMLIFSGCAGCSKLFLSPQHSESIPCSVMLDELKAGTTYYWKVVALGEQGINSESRVRRFTTI